MSCSSLESINLEKIGWGVEEKLEELQTKIKFKEGHIEEFKSKCNIEKEEKREKILIQRQNNKILRGNAHKALHPHGTIIGEALQYEKTKNLAFNRMTAPNAIRAVDLQKIDNEKKYNLILHKRKMKEKELAEIKLKLEDIINTLKREKEKSKMATEQLKMIQYIENEIKKKITKEEIAYFVMKQYLLICEILENDMIHFENDLQVLADDIHIQKAEIIQLSYMLHQERLAKEQIMKKFQIEGEMVYKSALEQQQKLIQLEDEYENICELDKTDRKRQRIGTQLSLKIAIEEERRHSLVETEAMLAMYEEMNEKFKEITMAGEFEQIEQILVSQDVIKQYLMEEKRRREEYKSQLLDQLALYEKSYLEMVDSVDRLNVKNKEKTEELKQNVSEEKKKMTDTQDTLNNLGSLLTRIKDGAQQLCMKMENIDSDTENIITFKRCQQNFANLVNDIKNQLTFLKKIGQQKISYAAFLEHMQSSNAREKRRINYPKDREAPTKAHTTLYETDENIEDTIPRAAIKAYAEEYAQKAAIIKKQQNKL